MKYYTTYLLILFTILSTPVFGNSGEGDKKNTQHNRKPNHAFLNSISDDSKASNNHFTLDIQFLGIDLAYNRRIYKDLFLGIQAGGGSKLSYLLDNPFTFSDGFLVGVLQYGVHLHYAKYSDLQFELGIGRLIYYTGDFNEGRSTTFNVGTYTGWKEIQLGVKLALGKSYSNKIFVYSSLLIVRISLNNWDPK